MASGSLAFRLLLFAHILVGLASVLSGVVAMLSPKRAGRHPAAGTLYYACLFGVFASSSLMAAMHWNEDFRLFLIGTSAFLSATFGRTALRRRWRAGLRLHIAGMGTSYVLLLTGFYVESGAKLPLWKELPPVAYWIGPAAIGAPLIARALLRNPRALPKPSGLGGPARAPRRAEEHPRIQG